jgi:TPR repeat protein
MFLYGRILLTIFIICFLFTGCASARKVYMAENLQAARLTFESGDFKKAFCALLPLAVEGSRQAQYAVGYMYYYGYGTTMDPVSGLFWIKRSADQHYPPAMKALAVIENCEKAGDKKCAGPTLSPTPTPTPHY